MVNIMHMKSNINLPTLSYIRLYPTHQSA